MLIRLLTKYAKSTTNPNFRPLRHYDYRLHLLVSQGESKLVLTQKPYPYGLVLIILEGSMHAPKGE